MNKDNLFKLYQKQKEELKKIRESLPEELKNKFLDNEKTIFLDSRYEKFYNKFSIFQNECDSLIKLDSNKNHIKSLSKKLNSFLSIAEELMVKSLVFQQLISTYLSFEKVGDFVEKLSEKELTSLINSKKEELKILTQRRDVIKNDSKIETLKHLDFDF